MSFPNHRGDSGKCDKRTVCHHRKCIPGKTQDQEDCAGGQGSHWTVKPDNDDDTTFSFYLTLALNTFRACQ
jgi:hypothetical protein